MSQLNGQSSTVAPPPHGTDMAQVRHAQTTWAAQPVSQRLNIIRRMRHAVAQQALDLAQTKSPDLQLSPRDTLISEILPLADACRYLERNSTRLLAPQRLSARHRPLWLRGVDIELYREPYGVVLIIAPTNYPIFLPGVQLLQALTAGNAVLLKPGLGGRPAGLALANLLRQSGLAPDLLHILPEAPSAAQTAMANGVDKIVFTGAATTGERILADSAPHLIPTTLELSGCDAALVHATADLDLVCNALCFSLRLNSSATCIAPRRVIVDQPQAAELEQRLGLAISSLPPCAVSPDTYHQAQALVTEACQQGARLVSGTFLPNYQMTPILVADATPVMPLTQADLFAPVLSLMQAQHEADVLDIARQGPYALGASIFGQSNAINDWAQRVPAGVVTLNDVIVPTADPRLPFGGRGRSGYGKTRGAEGLLNLTTVKAIARRKGRWRPHYERPHEQDSALFQAYIMAVHAGSWRDRWTALLTLVRHLATRAPHQPGDVQKDKSKPTVWKG